MGRDDLHCLIRRIGAPDRIGWGVALAGEGTLCPGEEAAVMRAVPDRRAEFAAGRSAARDALRALGLPPAAIPAGPDRAPVWPAGVVGSISHAAGLCIAAVARHDDCAMLGVDVESDTPLASDLIPEICRAEELTGIACVDRPTTAKRLFSAKEAAYKAHYPRVRQIFGFHALSVDLTRGCARFSDHPDVAAIPPESRGDLPLRQAVVDGLILSLCAAPARPSHG